MIRTRFAPSPTGRLHLGNARTALFNALLARREGGTFVLRVEDTDAERSRDEHLDELMHVLRWLGLDWTEGPDADGAFGPYRQSERGNLYKTYFDRLVAGDHAYPCFCTPEELAGYRAEALAQGRPPRYPGICARLSRAAAERRLAAGEPASLRFRVGRERSVTYRDLVRGEQSVVSGEIGDFVVRRADGTPAFLFANALDDALMGITHVLRGEDHVANTPRQLLLLEALELTAPVYGHLPLVVDAEDRPLSKRSGSVAISALEAGGILPEAIGNYLLRLGHTTSDTSLLSREGLARAFDERHLGRAPAHYDSDQLAHWQRLAIAELDADAAARWSGAHLADPQRWESFWALVRDNVAEREDVRLWADALSPQGAIAQEATQALAQAEPTLFVRGRELSAEPDYKQFVAALGNDTGLRGRKLFRPLRAALTGRLQGPELARVWAFLSPAERAARFERALTICKDATDASA